MKLTDLSLEALYGKPKITKAVEDAIIQKEDFSQISENYCEKVCQIKCKSYENVDIDTSPVDILIIQNHKALPEKWRTADQAEETNRAVITELCRKNFPGLTYRLTDLFKCKIQPADFTKGNKPPLFTKLSKCRPYVLEEIRQAQPKVIISLGTNVTKILGLPYSNYNNCSEIHNNVVLTLHPQVCLMIRQIASGKMWGPDFYEVIDSDFKKAADLARGDLEIPSLIDAIEYQKNNIQVARTLTEVEQFMADIYDQPDNTVFSFDTETTGLDPWAADAKLLTIQIGFRDRASGEIKSYVIPLNHRSNTNYHFSSAMGYIHHFLSDARYHKIGHHAKFDIKYIFVVTGIRVQGLIFDTMLMMHSVNSGLQGMYGLKAAIWTYAPELGIGGYENLLPKLTREAEIESEAESE